MYCNSGSARSPHSSVDVMSDDAERALLRVFNLQELTGYREKIGVVEIR